MIPRKRNWKSNDSSAASHGDIAAEEMDSVVDNDLSLCTLDFEDSWATLWPSIFRTDEVGLEQTGNELAPDIGATASFVICADGDSIDSEVCPDLSAAGSRIDHWADAAIAQIVSQDDGKDTPQDNGMEHAGGLTKCFGMLHALDARLLGDMVSLRSELAKRKTETVLLEVALGSQCVSLCLDDRLQLAQLSDDLNEPLAVISAIPSVSLQAFANVSSTIRCIERAKRLHEARIKVGLNVYGHTGAREEVGRRLAAHKRYLQHPLHQRSSFAYDNPHMLAFEDLSLDEAADQELELPSLTTSSQVPRVAREICESETRDRNLLGMKSDGHVKSTLLPHQESALQFMVQKEREGNPMDFQLWRPAVEAERRGFRHAVTGLWAAAPPRETRSGILADDTGMGKTLSTLSLVTKTLAEAWMWSQVPEHERSHGSGSNVRSRATVIVVSSILIMNEWSTQIADHLDGSLKALKYHGRRRESLVSAITDADIVLTTYHILAMEMKAKKPTLNSIHWYRIVLDEAHTVRRQATSLFAAVYGLDAIHRWCLTATPIQNKLEDLGSLLAFIRAEPFDRSSLFRKYVIAPFSDDINEGRRRLSLVCDSFCLRRNKDRLDLPTMEETCHIVEMSDAEKAFYDHTFSSMARALSHGSREKHSGTPFGKFQIQMQLRLICNHGTFQKPFIHTSLDRQTQKEDAISLLGAETDIKCSFCKLQMPVLATSCTNTMTKSCSHILCDECEAQVSANNSVASLITDCPTCASKHSKNPSLPTKRLRLTASISTSVFRKNGRSSKIDALIKHVMQDLESSKSIIFSSWTRSLNLLALHLDRQEISYVRIDGDTELYRRQGILDGFADELGARILLMTTGTGAYGLNLTVANRVFILEPQWNPSVELQAISRAQRYLQRRTVKVVRYIVRGTVEEDVQRQQSRKIAVAEMGFQPEQS